jgi:hypothetical protein
MTIVPFMLIMAGVFAVLLLFCLGVAIAINQPAKPTGTPKTVTARLRIVPVPPLANHVPEIRNVISNVRFPINS